MVDLQNVRKQLGLTQQDVETVTDIDTATLSLYENGLRIPSVKNAMILGKVYGIDWTRFFEEGERNDRPEPKTETS